jgi:hypothetical protein
LLRPRHAVADEDVVAQAERRTPPNDELVRRVVGGSPNERQPKPIRLVKNRMKKLACVGQAQDVGWIAPKRPGASLEANRNPLKRRTSEIESLRI